MSLVNPKLTESQNWSKSYKKKKTFFMLLYQTQAARKFSSSLAKFDLTVRISISLMFWKLDINIFIGTPRSAQSESEKTFKYAFEVELGKKLGLLMSTLDPEATKWPSEAEGSFFSYLTPKPPSDK